MTLKILGFFTVNYSLQLTVNSFSIFMLNRFKLLAVLRLSVNPIETPIFKATFVIMPLTFLIIACNYS